jgi:hypothetical protein
MHTLDFACSRLRNMSEQLSKSDIFFILETGHQIYSEEKKTSTLRQLGINRFSRLRINYTRLKVKLMNGNIVYTTLKGKPKISQANLKKLLKEEFQEEIKGNFSILMNGEFVSEQMEVPSHADLEIIPVKQEGHFTIKMEILGKETIIEIKINPKMQLK